jgi:hypothetical protein
MKKYIFLSQINLPIIIGTLFSATCVFAETKEVSWTGPYAGLIGGHTWGESSMNLTPGGSYLTNLDVIPVLENGGAQTYNPNGFIGAAEVGYNYQINHFVIGLEGDFSYQDLSQSRRTGPVPIGVVDSVGFDGRFKSNWFSTVRTRIGYATGNLLGFVTGDLLLQIITSILATLLWHVGLFLPLMQRLLLRKHLPAGPSVVVLNMHLRKDGV